MRLDQFDKLQVLVKDLEDMARVYRQKNNRLSEEITELKGKLSILQEENLKLKEKNEEARERLNLMIEQVDQRISG